MQVLAKASDTDFDSAWVDQTGGGTTVVANPSGTGGDALERITIDTDRYRVKIGGRTYLLTGTTYSEVDHKITAAVRDGDTPQVGDAVLLPVPSDLDTADSSDPINLRITSSGPVLDRPFVNIDGTPISADELEDELLEAFLLCVASTQCGPRRVVK